MRVEPRNVRAALQILTLLFCIDQEAGRTESGIPAIRWVPGKPGIGG